MRMRRLFKFVPLAVVMTSAALLAGCGGGSSSGGSNTPAGSFTLSVSASTSSIIEGASKTVTVTVTPKNGFTGDVKLTAAGVPTGLSAKFSPATVTGGSGTSTLTLSAQSVSAGTYTVKVDGASGSLTDSTSVKTTITVPPSTSGQLGVMSVGGEVYAFVPTPGGVSYVGLSATAPTPAPALAPSSSTSSGSLTLDFTVNSCAADQVNLKIVCIGYNSSKVAVYDVSPIASGKAPTKTEFDLGNTVASSFSGGGCLNCGVLTDPANNRFVLSSGDGYRVVKYDGTVVSKYLNNPKSTDPQQYSTENFAFDPVHQWIISPEYEQTPSYLWVIDLKSGKSYKWDTALTDPSMDIQEADAAAVDPSTDTVWVDKEYYPLLLGLNMKSASFGTGTFSAPSATTAPQNVYSDGDFTTGMAIDPSSHIMLLEDEFTANFGAAQLPSSSGTSAPTISAITSAAMPQTTGNTNCDYWENPGDPHGLAVIPVGFIGKDAYGVLFNYGQTCLALVDVTKLLAAPKTSGTNEIDPKYDLVKNGVVKFVPLP